MLMSFGLFSVINIYDVQSRHMINTSPTIMITVGSLISKKINYEFKR